MKTTPIFTACLVGRTNVGKSTLFNRIIGKHKALVADVPNLTRDRNYGECVWNAKKIRLIDTGGVETHEGSFEHHWITRNVMAGVCEAQCVLFLVDGHEGLNPFDTEILSWLRKQGKPLILVVNKTDSKRDEMNAAEFYQLGIDTVIAVSAVHGTGLHRLMDALAEAHSIPDEQTPQPHTPVDIHIAVVGKPNVGKSSLVNKILGEERVLVSEVPGTTRDAIDTFITHGTTHYCLIDTAGIRRKHRFKDTINVLATSATETSIARCDVAVLLIDAVSGLTEQDLRIARIIADHGKGCVIAVNKWDLIDEKDAYVKEIKSLISTMFPFLTYAPQLFISAKTGTRVEKIFSLVDDVFRAYTQTIPHEQVHECIRTASARQHPPRTKRGEAVLIKTAKQVGTKPPTFFVQLNRDAPLGASYLRYLENTLREKYNFLGTPLRIFARKNEKQKTPKHKKRK